MGPSLARCLSSEVLPNSSVQVLSRLHPFSTVANFFWLHVIVFFFVNTILFHLPSVRPAGRVRCARRRRGGGHFWHQPKRCHVAGSPHDESNLPDAHHDRRGVDAGCQDAARRQPHRQPLRGRVSPPMPAETTGPFGGRRGHKAHTPRRPFLLYFYHM